MKDYKLFLMPIVIILLVFLSLTSSCKKEDTLPVLTTSDISKITDTSAISGGNITGDGGQSVTARGICWNTSPNPTIVLTTKTLDSLGIGEFKSYITDLTPGKTYYVRAYASNVNGTAYGNEKSFATEAVTPKITTSLMSSISFTSAVGGGNIISDGGLPITTRGVCWSTTKNPTVDLSSKTSDGEGAGEFVSSISDLVMNTKYYLRAFAINSTGVGYGKEISFITLPSGSYIVHDVDGNQYNTVTIGSQVWLVENLKTTKFNDYTNIPYVTDDAEWEVLTSPAYCWYDNDIAKKETELGALYNWYVVDTVSNGNKNICPPDWHVPTEKDWDILTNYLSTNGYGFEGSGDDIAKSLASESGWYCHGFDTIPGNVGYNLVNNNASGFTGLPAGHRLSTGDFFHAGRSTTWWSNSLSAIGSDSYPYSRGLEFFISNLRSGTSSMNVGISIRCVRDSDLD